jgi:hypothetical protein
MNLSKLNAQQPGGFDDDLLPNPKFSLYGGYGLSYLNYTMDIGKRESGMGLNAGLSYRFGSFGFGFSIGAEIAQYNTTFLLDSLTTEQRLFDKEMTDLFPDGEPFDFRSKLTEYREVQNAMMLQVPLMLQYQSGGSAGFFFGIGGKVGIPISGKHKTTVAEIKNTGYYPYINNGEGFLYDVQKFLGFGTFVPPETERESPLELKPAFFLSIETGLRIALGGAAVYLGVFLDYGLNDISEVSNKPFVEYNMEDRRNFKINSAIHSNLADIEAASESSGAKVNPMAIGLKLRFSF